MPALYFDETQAKTVDGVEYVPHFCWKCGGSGYLPGYEFSDGARCWACMAHRGPLGWRTREEYDRIMARRAKDQERRARKAAEEAAERAKEILAWREANADLVEALEGYAGHSSFLLDLAARVLQGDVLTDAQVEVARKALQAEAEREAAEIEVPEGRQTVEGVVVSLKDYEDTFSPYGGRVWKMVVDCGGFRLFGGVPRAILDEVEKGAKVRFTAALQPKEKGFGYYKRPTKPEVLEAAS